MQLLCVFLQQIGLKLPTATNMLTDPPNATCS